LNTSLKCCKYVDTWRGQVCDVDGNGSSGNWLEGTSNDNEFWFVFPFVGIKTWIPFQNSSCIILSLYNWMINHPLFKYIYI
jgi:hypothetical protein